LIWNLLLAHLLADFPLQPMWLVRSKERIWGLAMHGTVHFLTALLMVGASRAVIWPQVLALAAFHFMVDVVKYRLGIKDRVWAVVSYFVDQAIHVVSLIVIAGWIMSIAPEATGLVDPAIAVYACGYLIATHVWYVTEKTISQGQIAYRDELETTLWPRMLVRAGLLSGLLYAASLALPLAATLQLPYQKDRQWRRALITDIIVTVLATIFIRLASNSA